MTRAAYKSAEHRTRSARVALSDGDLNTEELASEMGVSWSTAQRTLQRLKRDGYVEARRVTTVTYSLTDAARERLLEDINALEERCE